MALIPIKTDLSILSNTQKRAFKNFAYRCRFCNNEATELRKAITVEGEEYYGICNDHKDYKEGSLP